MFSWFHRRELYEGPIVDLKLRQTLDGRSSVPSVLFDICLHGTETKVGDCDLRLGMNQEFYYAGNIGYHIRPDYRGHGYAYQACLILFQIASRQYRMKELIITCSPGNIASRKTLEKLNGTLLETVEVPHDHWLYRRGETVKNIYRYQL